MRPVLLVGTRLLEVASLNDRDIGGIDVAPEGVVDLLRCQRGNGSLHFCIPQQGTAPALAVDQLAADCTLVGACDRLRVQPYLLGLLDLVGGESVLERERKLLLEVSLNLGHILRSRNGAPGEPAVIVLGGYREPSVRPVTQAILDANAHEESRVG